MQVYFMYVKMWHYTTRTHSHMYSLILCMHVCMYAMPCHAMHVCMLEHVGTHVCSALFSHMHMKYTSVCGGGKVQQVMNSDTRPSPQCGLNAKDATARLSSNDLGALQQ
jgi:hypothetical protein